MKSLFFFILLSIAACHPEKLCAAHPLWVGYECTDLGRTPGFSGKIDKELIGKYLPPNPVIVEAGSYDGTDTFSMAAMWPNSTIYAFEPIPYLYGHLKTKSALYKNVRLFDIGLSNTTGWQKFYISSGASAGSSSLLPPSGAMEILHGDISFKESVNIYCMTLDDWAASMHIDHVDCLWLDLQGIEPVLLQASPKILEHVQVILTEVNLVAIYENSVTYPAYKLWLESQGFELVREDMPWFDGGDALFVRVKK